MNTTPSKVGSYNQEDFEAMREVFLESIRKSGINTDPYRTAVRGNLSKLTSEMADIGQNDESPKIDARNFAIHLFFLEAMPVRRYGQGDVWQFPDSRGIFVHFGSVGVLSLADAYVASKYQSPYSSRPVAAKLPAKAPEPKHVSERDQFYAGVDEVIKASEHDGLVVKRDKNNVYISQKDMPEIRGDFQLKPTASRDTSAEQQIAGFFERDQSQRELFHAQLEHLKDTLGLVRTHEKGCTTYRVPGMSDSIKISSGESLTTEGATNKLKILETAILQKHSQRRQRLQSLEQKGFTADIQIIEGTPTLILSHPTLEGWTGQTATMTPLCRSDENTPVSEQCYVSDEAESLIRLAEKQHSKSGTETMTTSSAAIKTSPSGNGIATSRVNKTPSIAPVVLTNGVIVRNWQANIAPHQRPTLCDQATYKLAQPNGNGTHKVSVATPQDQVDILIDTSVLSALETRRTGGRKWLDVIKVLESLPNVNLGSTSYVGDFEFGGVIPHHVTRQDHERTCNWSDADPALARISRAEHERIFKNATRLAVDENNELFPKLGRNTMHVWESGGQHALYRELECELSTTSPGSDEYKRRLKKFRQLHADEGEVTLYHYTQSSQSMHPVIILANDKRFAERFQSDNPEAFRNLMTAAGDGISVCSTKDLLDALNKACGGNFVDEINKHGGSEASTSYSAFAAAFNIQHNDSHLFDNSPFRYVHGKKADGTPEDTLADVIRKGIQLRDEQHSKINGADLGPHTRQQNARPGLGSWGIAE